MRNSAGLSVLRVIWLIACCPLLAAAWTQQDSLPAGAVEEVIDVEIVNLDVRVVDKKGRPIMGLTKEDFVVIDEGRPVELTNFAEFNIASPPGAPEQASESEPPRSVSAELVDRPRSTKYLIVYIDNLTMPPNARSRMLEPVGDFVASQISHGMEVLLMSYNPGLRPMTPITSDYEVVSAALERMGKGSALGLGETLDRRTAFRGIQEVYQRYLDLQARFPGMTPCNDGWEEMIAIARSYAATASNRAYMSIAGLRELASSLGGLEGRKAVLYVGYGFQQRPGLDLFQFLGEQLCPARQQDAFAPSYEYDVSSELARLSASANVNRVTVYSLDAAGTGGMSTASVEFDDRRFTPSARNDQVRKANFQNSMFVMSDETGGYAIFNANDPSHDLENLSSEFEHYYSLGYSAPTGAQAGVRREVYIKLASGSRKYELRYRRTYELKTRQAQMAERTLATLLYDLQDNPLQAEMTLGRPLVVDKHTSEMPIDLSIPVGALTTVPAGEGEKGLIRIVMAARDEEGKLSAVLQKLLEFHVEPGEFSGEESPVHVFSTKVEIGHGPHSVALAVRDELSGETSYIMQTLDVAPMSEEGVSEEEVSPAEAEG